LSEFSYEEGRNIAIVTRAYMRVERADQNLAEPPLGFTIPASPL